MVTVLRTPQRPESVRPATCTWSYLMKNLLARFVKDEFRRHRDRIRPDRRRHLARDHRGGERPRHQPEQQVHLDQRLAEVSGHHDRAKRPRLTGAFLVSIHFRWRFACVIPFCQRPRRRLHSSRPTHRCAGYAWRSDYRSWCWPCGLPASGETKCTAGLARAPASGCFPIVYLLPLGFGAERMSRRPNNAQSP